MKSIAFTSTILLLFEKRNPSLAFHAPTFRILHHSSKELLPSSSSSLDAAATTTNLSTAFNSVFTSGYYQELQNLVGGEKSIVFPTTLATTTSSSSSTYAQIQIPKMHLSTSEDLIRAFHDLPLTLLHLQNHHPWHLAIISLLILGTLLRNYILQTPTFEEYTLATPYESGRDTYDPNKAQEFYSQRPLLVLRRILRLSYLTSAFNIGLLFDWLVLGKLMQDTEYTALRNNEPQRAKEALRLCTQLGPTFIKLGQALSIRTDIVPELYALELRQLQDAVPPFQSDVARSVLKRELGVSDLTDIFVSLSKEPVASASIGQVYRGILKDTTTTTTTTSTTGKEKEEEEKKSGNVLYSGKDVAVKVQRPGILGEIALDLHVLRLLTPIQTRLQNAINGRPTYPEDINQGLALVDEWGRGFVAETDYRLEATNTIQFEYAMRQRGLDAVCAPKVVPEMVRDKVLITEWVSGTRLDKDASLDVPRLCGVAINAYLTMLLDTGVLHCDPHPGNLLRTTDGKLCILDWGMTLNVPNDLQYALLEFIAHINSEDYDSIPQDFINLGFSPENVSLERLQSSGITEGLSFAFRQLSQGGGPKKIQERVKEEFKERYGETLTDSELRDAARAEMLQRMENQLASEGVDVKGVTNIMEEMSRRNRELFSLPPYVLYVARAFSTLEGIGLSIDENYAIIRECYPYLARRLFTDKSPRAKAALRSMLGLSNDDESERAMTTSTAHHPQQQLISTTTSGSTTTSSSSSGLAVVQAGVTATTTTARHGNNKAKKTLSPKKLLEMTDNFASYTAATATVDRDGEGRAAAAKEFAKLLLDKEGSTLQEILVEEAAKLGDAATRSLLRQAFVDSAFAKVVANSLRAPKDAMDRFDNELGHLLPENLKKVIIDTPADVPRLVDELLQLTSEDDRILSTASELQEVVGGRFENTSLRSLLAENLSDGASIIPTLPDLSPGLQSILTNAENREFVIEQFTTNVPSLGRRIGAELFRRAAYRARNSPVLSEEVRRQISDLNNRVADVIEPTISKK